MTLKQDLQIVAHQMTVRAANIMSGAGEMGQVNDPSFSQKYVHL